MIQNGKKYLLFKEYPNGYFPKVVDNNLMKMQATPKHILPYLYAGHTIHVSVIKNGGMGFACAEVEVCGYSYGDTVSICKLRCWYEGDFVLHAEHVDAVEVPVCDSPQYKSIQILICCKTLIISVRAALAD